MKISHYTSIDGIQFRSRLEARWHIFFNSLGIITKYEPRCFELIGGLTYKPDFYIEAQPRFPTTWWFEVKPSIDSDLTKPELFSLALCCNVGILTDLPADKSDSSLCRYHILSGGGGDSDYAFTQCERCGAIGFCWEGLADRIGCNCNDEARHGFANPALLSAYLGARATKFS